VLPWRHRTYRHALCHEILHGTVTVGPNRPRENRRMAGAAGGTNKGWLVLAGTGFWVLVFAGIFNENGTLLGAAVVLALVTAVIVIRDALRGAAARKAERERVWAVGTPAQAHVVSISTGRGGGFNDHPMIDFVLDVTVGGAPARRLTTSAVISQIAIPRVQPGCEIAVRIDPLDDANLVVDPALTPYV
jgi:hypothetical protein